MRGRRSETAMFWWNPRGGSGGGCGGGLPEAADGASGPAGRGALGGRGKVTSKQSTADFDQNGIVDGADLQILLKDWGPCS